MILAKLAYLTTPKPGMFVLNIQPEGSTEITQIEISRAHLANVIIDGTSLALRETSINRVPFNPGDENAHERDRPQQQPAD